MFKCDVSSGSVLNDIKVFQPSVNYDLRGSIFTSFNKSEYQIHLPEGVEFIHDKFAESKNNVLRGLHGDSKTWKLISCIYGEIFEVVVDMRIDSPTYMKWEAFELTGKNKRQVLVPPSFVNGYYVKSEFAVFHYKLAYKGEYFDISNQEVIRWNDKRLGIQWPCDNPILQPRDK